MYNVKKTIWLYPLIDDALLNPQKYTPSKESIQHIEQKVRELWDNLL